MISGHKVLGLIPARGGSKGIPRKNIRLLGDKPLIAWTIEEAKKSAYIDHLVVSTDDQEIADIAKQLGASVPFMRPASLATDAALGIDVVLHALTQLPDYEAVIVLQPTSPFRSTDDIDGAIQLWAKTDSMVVGVTKASESPYWMYLLDEQRRLQAVLTKQERAANRQELPPVHVLNGAVYVASREQLLDQMSFVTPTTTGYEMPGDRSIDFDTEEDWEYAEWILERTRRQHG